MNDQTESVRRELLDQMRSLGPRSREQLEQTLGRVWNTQQMVDEFEVLGFLAPFVVVRRKVDGVKGSLMFQHDPRFFFSFVEDQPG